LATIPIEPWQHKMKGTIFEVLRNWTLPKLLAKLQTSYSSFKCKHKLDLCTLHNKTQSKCHKTQF
jgi:hypothetical protein